MRSGHDQTGAALRDQIVRAFRQPLFVELHRVFLRLQGGDDRPEFRALRQLRNLGRERMREGGNLTGRHAQTMIGHRAGERVAILHHVEPVHRILRSRDAATVGERARARDIAFAAIEKIRA